MSKRNASGAFDALVHAIADLGAVPTRAGLPRATAPASLGRGLAQGVLHGRLPRGDGTCSGKASPLPAERLTHEGQRSVAELGAILWTALDGPREAPELAPQMAPPQRDSIVALAITRRRLAEYAVPETIDRSTAFPGPRVWLIEIEHARGDTPAGIAVWRSRGAEGEWRTRCACVWIQGRIGSAIHPLVIGAQWGADASDAVAGACVIGPSWNDACRAAKERSRATVLARRQNAIGPEMLARIAIPAALAWLDDHDGVARPAGRFGAKATPAGGSRSRSSLTADAWGPSASQDSEGVERCNRTVSPSLPATLCPARAAGDAARAPTSRRARREGPGARLRATLGGAAAHGTTPRAGAPMTHCSQSLSGR